MQAKDKLIRYLIIGFVCLLFATPKTADANILRVEKSRDIIVETSLYTAVFSTRGAALKSLTLNHYRQDCSGCREDIWPKIKWYFSSINRTETEKRSKTEGLVELVSARDDMPYPLALTFSESSINVTPDAVYETGVNRLNLAEGETGTLVFTKTLPGVQIDKIYSFDSSNYKITLQIKLRNMSGNALVQRPVINWYHFMDNDGNGMSTAVAVVKNIVERKPFSSLSGESVMGPDVTWGGVENKYFIAAFIPDNPAESYYMASRETDNMVAGKMKSSKTLIEDGQEGLFSYTLFMGPKEYDLLIPFRVGLERSVDFGLLRFLSVPFLFLLNILYALIGSYGIAIVLMALIVKLVFLPLSNKTMRTMKAMQYLRPQIDAIKEQFKGDRNKIGQETMALYRAKKVNPFGGCLPVLIQIPVFLGLYKVFSYAVELRHSPFFFWIQDLSVRDPYYITPVLLAASQFLVQRWTPSAGSETQNKIQAAFPVVFLIVFMSVPAGLVLFWLVSNLFQIGQLYFLRRQFEQDDLAMLNTGANMTTNTEDMPAT